VELATGTGLLEIKILRFDNIVPTLKIYRLGFALTLFITGIWPSLKPAWAYEM